MKGTPHQPTPSASAAGKRRRTVASAAAACDGAERPDAPLPRWTTMEVCRQSMLAFGWECAARALAVAGMSQEDVQSFMDTHCNHVLGGEPQVFMNVGLAPRGSEGAPADTGRSLFVTPRGVGVVRGTGRTLTVKETREAANQHRIQQEIVAAPRGDGAQDGVQDAPSALMSDDDGDGDDDDDGRAERVAVTVAVAGGAPVEQEDAQSCA